MRDPYYLLNTTCSHSRVTAGSYCFEVCVLSDGLARLGWSTAASALELGTDKGGYGYGGTGKKSNSKDFKDYGSAFGEGDVIGCYITLEGGCGNIQFTKNGTALGCAYDLPGAGGSFYFPAICLKKCGVDVNFGDRPWKFSPLAGFKGYSLLLCNRISSEIPIALFVLQNQLGRCSAHFAGKRVWCCGFWRRALQRAYRNNRRACPRSRRADGLLFEGLLQVFTFN